MASIPTEIICADWVDIKSQIGLRWQEQMGLCSHEGKLSLMLGQIFSPGGSAKNVTQLLSSIAILGCWADDAAAEGMKEKRESEAGEE
jgi:hypothetical protein